MKDPENVFALIVCGSIAMVACTIVICLCYYNTAITKEAMKSGLEQTVVGNATIWTKPKQ